LPPWRLDGLDREPVRVTHRRRAGLAAAKARAVPWNRYSAAV